MNKDPRPRTFSIIPYTGAHIRARPGDLFSKIQLRSNMIEKRLLYGLKLFLNSFSVPFNIIKEGEDDCDSPQRSLIKDPSEPN